MLSEPDLSIIIVSFNTRKLTEDCLLSIDRHLQGKLEFETLVVDNASTDGSAEWLRGFAQDRSRLRVHLSPENVGFSGGNNIGLRMARGRNVLLLNSDAYLIDDSAVSAMAYLDAHPGVFACACLLLTGDGKPGPSYGFFPSPGILAREIISRRFTQLRAVCPLPGEPTHEIDFPCGAFYLMKGSLLREVGELDEGFFVYFEETDLARRAWDRGYKCVYFGDARAVHLGGQSSQEVKSMDLTQMFYRNWRRYLLKHHGHLASMAVLGMLGGYFSMALLVQWLRRNATAAGFFKSHLKAAFSGWR